MTSSLGQSVVVVIDEATNVGDARRRTLILAAELGFDEINQGKAALVATEAASNLVKHSGGGQLILKGLSDGPAGPCLEILTIDSGRGMSDLSRCMVDGYSTVGTPGSGLGAIGRLADSFEIYSGPDGTVLWARLHRKPGLRASHHNELLLGVVRVSAPGEQVCGDDWATVDRDDLSFVLMVDGLGHGPPAALAAEESVRIFQGHRSREPAEIVESTHRAIRGTRGAALAIARLDLARNEVRYAAVGNICGIVVDRGTGQTTSMVSHNGTVGFAIRKIQSYDYAWTEDSILLMHSDGLATHWNLDRYPGIWQRHPSLIAGLLYRDHKRGRDDVTVLVARPRDWGTPVNMPLLNLQLRVEFDIVMARQRARQIAALLGFALLDQTRIATATSEIARNSVQYAGGGRVEFSVESGPAPAFVIRVLERGPGIRDLQQILDGQYVSSSGLGLGIIGARRLMDRFAIESDPEAGAASVLMAKNLPNRTIALTAHELGRISAELAKNAPQGLLEELQQQNQELLNTLQELRDSQAEIAQMHSRELDETNRGVVALYAELDDGTKALQRLSDLKSQFLSEMSHELRSPLNSIKGLTGFLLARATDGDLSPEQEKQVQFIRQAAEGLSTLVDDVLDVAKVEAGKATIRNGSFEISDLFENLQGTIRPMVDHQSVSLIFDQPIGVPSLESDEGKIRKILRNFLTNAVKFTERGQIRVSARRGPNDVVIFAVKDSGIGIAGDDLDRIFEEYGQIENPLQKRVKGIGLGLPLTRKLAQLIGGSVSVESEPGVGSTFFAVIPRVFRRGDEHEAGSGSPSKVDPTEVPWSKTALIVDDRERDRYLIKGTLMAFGHFEIIEADHGEQALLHARSTKPDVIFLDLVLPDMTGFEILDRLKSEEETREIPVIVNTSRILDENERGRLSALTTAILAKGNASRDLVIAEVHESLMKAGICPPVTG